MPKRPSSIRRNALSAVLFGAGFSACACAGPEDTEYAPPVGNGGSAGISGETSGSGNAGTNVAGTSTLGGSSGSGGAGGSSGNGASGGSSGTSGRAGSSSGGSGGTSGASGAASGASGASGAGVGGSGNSAGTGTSGSGGAPAGGLPFLDDFEDGDAAGWMSVDDEGVEIDGWSILMDGSNVFKQGSASSDPSWSIGGNVAWTDQVVEVKLKFDEVPDESSTAMIAARFSSFESFYYLELRGDGGLKIRKRFDGSTGDVARYDPDVPLTAGTWYSVGLGAVGSTLTAYLGGVPVAMGTDTEVLSGGIGIGTTEEAIVAFDDVSVMSP